MKQLQGKFPGRSWALSSWIEQRTREACDADAQALEKATAATIA